MLEIEELLNNLITENNYDKRIIPYIKEFFRYNAKEFNWTKEEIEEKNRLIAKKVRGVEFVDLGDKYALTDHSFKNMLINRDIKGRDLSSKEIISLTSEVFLNLEIATKEDEEVRNYWKDNKQYPLINLKYSKNNYDKENILNIISNAFNIDIENIYDIEEIFRNELENSSNDNKTRKRFLEDSLTIFIPSLKECISKVINVSNLNEKSQQYLSIYATSLLAMKYRLENESEDKALIKAQYKALIEKLSEIAEDYVITADRLEKHKIDNTFIINIEQRDNEIREQLKDVKEAKEKQKIEVRDLGKSLSDEFIQEASCINNEEKLNDTYIHKQIAKVLPRYDERFRPIIQDYLVRSAKVYNWTKDEFDKKLRNYIKNIEKIEFKKELEGKVGQRISNLGYWSRNNKKFIVKDDMILSTNNEVLDVFFHEQEHSTDMTMRNNKQDLEFDLQYEYIKEYATEIGAIHLVGDKIYDDELCFTHNISGYDEIKYAGSMISAALGISEFEFARLKDKGEVEFNKFFKEKYPYLNTETFLEKFDDILYRIDNAPSIMHMRQMSEAYADAYNMANRIIRARLEHESKLANNKEEFETKSKYEMAKIANNMKLAKRKLHLRNKFIKPIIEDDTILKKHSKVTTEDRKKYMYLVEEIYPEKNLKFDNQELSKHINRYFRHPIIGKIYNALGRNKVPMLNATTSFEEERREFYDRVIARNGVETNAQELESDNNRTNRKIEKTEKGNEAK